MYHYVTETEGGDSPNKRKPPSVCTRVIGRLSCLMHYEKIQLDLHYMSTFASLMKNIYKWFSSNFNVPVFY